MGTWGKNSKASNYAVYLAKHVCSSKTHFLLFCRRIAKSLDEKVFDAKLSLFNYTDLAKATNIRLNDVELDVHMGRIELVFLMKFINDVLAFIEPFSRTKEFMAEKADFAVQGASKAIIDGYASQTRAKLNINMDAPLIIIPIRSTNKVTFLADLGKLTLKNAFVKEHDRIYDKMEFELSDLQMHRVKIDEAVDSNEVIASCPIIDPITFHLEIKRNMMKSTTESDPAELKVTGVLKEISASMSTGDYNVLMAILVENFQEKGEFELRKNEVKVVKPQILDRNSLTLNVKSRYL